MLNKRQQQQFIYFFDQLCQAQQVIDKLKTDLQHRPGFNPHLLFEMLSQGNDEIIIAQMRRYLGDRIACSHRELYEIFEKFDGRRNGFISRRDFVREIVPFKSEKKYHNRQGVVNSQIETSFLEIVIELLKRFRIIEEARKEIGFIQPWEAFAHLDCWKKGIIGLGDLQKFYNDNDFQIGHESLEFLLHALRRRYHKDVTLELFCETLNPLEFGEYKKFAEEMSKENEKEFLKRSRHEQEAVRRSRIENQHLQYEVQRAQRRKKAELQRQLCLEERIDLELSDYDKHQQGLIRKALLEEQRDIRNRSLLENSILERDYLRTAQESRRIKEMSALREHERLVNENISRRLAQQQAAALSASKQRSVIDNEIAIQQEIQREKEAKRLLERARQQQLSRSRRQYEEDLLRERQFRLRQTQKDRLLQSYQPQASSLSRSIKKSRIQELEHELQKTRLQMRERRERLEREEKYRQLQTSTKSKVSAFHY